MQITATLTRHFPVRAIDVLVRVSHRIIAADTAYRERCKLASATPEQLEDMGIPQSALHKR